MAKAKVKAPAVSEETQASLAKFGKVTLAGGIEAARTIGDVPTIGGIQQQMCLLMLALGDKAGKAKTFDYAFPDVVNGYIGSYYGPGKGLGRSKPPTPATQDNMISSYSRFGAAGMHASRPGGWDAKPLALIAIECGLNSLGARAGVVKNFMTEKGRVSAPTMEEINAYVAKKLEAQNKTKAVTGKGGTPEKPWDAKATVGDVRAAAMTWSGQKLLQKFLSANKLDTKYDAMVEAMSSFATALELVLITDKGKASEKKIRDAAIASAQKTQKTDATVTQ